MISVKVINRKAYAVSRWPITSGSVGMIAEFLFSEEWDGLTKTAVFRGSGTEIDQVISNNKCTVPHEVLANAGGDLYIGVYGANGSSTIVIPTVWTNAGYIFEGTERSEVDPSDPTPSWADEVQAISDALDVSVSKSGSTATITVTKYDTDNDTTVTETVTISDGQDGATGQQGPQGPQGPTGPSGADGADGADGTDGATIWTCNSAPTHESPGGGKPDFDYYLDSSLSGKSGITPAAGDLIFYSSNYYPVSSHLDAAGFGQICVVGTPIDLSTKFWTNTQVGLLQQVFQHLKYDSASAGDIAAELITSLQGNAVWSQDQITLLDALLSHVKYTDAEGDTYADDLVDALCGNAISPITIPDLATATPVMDGAAAVGSSGKAAREDHVHPSDTAKQNKIAVSGILKGDGDGGVIAAVAGTDYLATAPVSSVDGKTGAVTVLPSGGTSGYVLKKASATDYDVEWAAESGGGAVSSVDGKTGAVTVLPSGGTSGYVLAKASASDYDVEWVAQSGGGSVSPYTSDPSAPGTADPGSSANYSRGDHVHPSEIAYCTYGTTTSAQIEAMLSAGQLPAVIRNDILYVYSYKSSTTKHYFASTGLSSLAYQYLTEDNGSWSATSLPIVPADVTISTTGSVSQTLDANKVYHFTGALTALTIAVNAAPTGVAAFYHFDFDIGATAFTPSLPVTWNMPSGTTYAANTHYEIDVVNNYGRVSSW